MKNHYFKILLLISLSFTACKRADDLFKSYGKETTKTRQVGNFNKLVVGEKFDLELVQDSTKNGRIEITAGANVIDGYTTEIVNNELQITNKNLFNWVRKLKVRQKVVVYFKILDEIQINGSARVWSRDTIQQKTMAISHDGLENAEFTVLINNLSFKGTNTGGLIFKGRSYIFSASVDNISFVNTKDMRTDDTYITSFSKADSYVDADKKLYITVFGSGNLYYSITPSDTLDLNQMGEGKIFKQ